MLASILLMISLLGLPILITQGEKRSRIVRWLSPIIICYLIGIAAGNIPGLQLNKELLKLTTGISVYLAIPLLLFSANFRLMLKQVRPAMFAFFLGIMGVISCTLFAYWILGKHLLQPAAVSGMMIGVYTGGTPNMNAIGLALGVEEEVFVLLNSADIVFSGLYFIFLLTLGKRILSLFLPSFPRTWNNHSTSSTKVQQMRPSHHARHVLLGLVLSMATLGISVGFSVLILRDWTLDRAIPFVILGITTLGIAASFLVKVRELPHTFSTANYLLLVFALAMGSMADFTELLAASSYLFLFCGMVVFGSVLVHFMLGYLFKIDRDTLIIASTAAIFGPPFIGPVANSIGNREIIAIGIALGLIGYAIGNYLGLGLSSLLN